MKNETFALIRERLRALQLGALPVAHASVKQRDGEDGARLEQLLRLASLSGRAPESIRFSDLDYSSQSRSVWPLHTVLERALLFSRAYARGRGGLLPIISAILRDWGMEGYPNSNWWQLDIGVPKLMSAILLLVGEDLEPELVEIAEHHILRGTIAGKPEIALRAGGIHQGANLLWHCATSIYHAVLTENAEELRIAAELSANETAGGENVGLQEDGSFFQHGRQLYSIGYGRSFLRECASMIYVLAGTEFAFSRIAVERVLTHLLDGIRYMVAGRGVDFTCVGREYMRPGFLRASTLLPSIELLALAEDIPRKDELISLGDAIRDGKMPLCGVKYFHVAKYLSLYTDKLHFAFKGSDSTLINSEIINRENVLGYNFSYGTVSLVMRTGEEYDNLATYWDYAKIPGTTSRIEDDAALLTYTDFQRTLPGDDFGGATKGDLGACYATVMHEGISATVAAFATPIGAVLLGCGLSEESGRALRTTVNQCRAEGDFAVKDGGRTVLHGGIRYTNLDGETAFVPEILHLYGNVNRNYLNAASVPTEGDVFSLTVPFSPKHAAYAYAITAEEDEAPAFEVVVNETALQAIRLPDGRGIAVVHRAGCTAPEGVGIDTSRVGVVFF